MPRLPLALRQLGAAVRGDEAELRRLVGPADAPESRAAPASGPPRRPPMLRRMGRVGLGLLVGAVVGLAGGVGLGLAGYLAGAVTLDQAVFVALALGPIGLVVGLCCWRLVLRALQELFGLLAFFT